MTIGESLMNQVLRPVRNHLSFDIVSDGQVESEATRGCYTDVQLDDVGGYYFPEYNRILLRNFGTNTIVHEFGHALYYIILDNQSRARIETLYYWCRDQRSDDYFPISPYSSATAVESGDIYSKKNEREFFAVLFEIRGLYNNASLPERNLNTPARRALLNIMYNLFSANAEFDLTALEESRIREAFAHEGIAYNPQYTNQSESVSSSHTPLTRGETEPAPNPWGLFTQTMVGLGIDSNSHSTSWFSTRLFFSIGRGFIFRDSYIVNFGLGLGVFFYPLNFSSNGATGLDFELNAEVDFGVLSITSFIRLGGVFPQNTENYSSFTLNAGVRIVIAPSSWRGFFIYNEVGQGLTFWGFYHPTSIQGGIGWRHY